MLFLSDPTARAAGGDVDARHKYGRPYYSSPQAELSVTGSVGVPVGNWGHPLLEKRALEDV